MQRAGLRGVSRRKWVCTTVRAPEARPAPDLVAAALPRRGSRPDLGGRHHLHSDLGGFLYLAIVLDVFSRRVVGWAMASHLRTELVLARSTWRSCNVGPREVIHHSDQGTQYTSIAFGNALPGNGRASVDGIGGRFLR